MNMVERVARGIIDAMKLQMEPAPGPVGHANFCDAGELDFRHIARATIEAMREPTEDMFKAEAKAFGEGYGAHDTWQSMIDAALNEGKE